MMTSERFWERVQVQGSDDCWPWLGPRTSKNPARAYGKVQDGGRSRPASKVAWELANGRPFPDGKLACHRCDNPPCCNPRHIFPGSMSDNLMDASAKGRIARGSRIGNATLTEELVREIRASAESNVATAKRLGISRQAVYGVRSRGRWGHVAQQPTPAEAAE